MSTIPYPYFYLGLEINIEQISQETLTDPTVWRTFTKEEITVPCDPNMLRIVQAIGGTPIPDKPSVEYTHIGLKEFISTGGVIPEECDLTDIQNIRIYFNGKPAEEGEDYELVHKEHKIKILWDKIEDTDIFSFSLPLKVDLW
jgi:hypothetical protein